MSDSYAIIKIIILMGNILIFYFNKINFEYDLVNYVFGIHYDDIKDKKQKVHKLSRKSLSVIKMLRSEKQVRKNLDFFKENPSQLKQKNFNDIDLENIYKKFENNFDVRHKIIEKSNRNNIELNRSNSKSQENDINNSINLVYL